MAESRAVARDARPVNIFGGTGKREPVGWQHPAGFSASNPATGAALILCGTANYFSINGFARSAFILAS
jgi:hypothetical protein